MNVLGKAVMSSRAPEPQGGLKLDVLVESSFGHICPRTEASGVQSLHQWSGAEEGEACRVTCPTSLFADGQLRP